MDIVEGTELRLAGILVVGRRSELAHRVPMAWLELLRRVPLADRFYGVFRDGDHGADGTYRYWVCAAQEGTAQEGLVEVTIPAQTYARVTIRGGADQIDAGYGALAGFIGDRSVDGFGYELYDPARQSVAPPYERFDYDVYRPVVGP